MSWKVLESVQRKKLPNLLRISTTSCFHFTFPGGVGFLSCRLSPHPWVICWRWCRFPVLSIISTPVGNLLEQVLLSLDNDCADTLIFWSDEHIRVGSKLPDCLSFSPGY
ncbi:uncharacterized protein [Scyliorhinus torazame]|uniref:uncharacterized protein isoform X5 n=1 Tax=Scyliorhinus torazame TaxID=75743 RepID=UPI003B58C58A